MYTVRFLPDVHNVIVLSVNVDIVSAAQSQPQVKECDKQVPKPGELFHHSLCFLLYNYHSETLFAAFISWQREKLHNI